jgi:hypothetical protein
MKLPRCPHCKKLFHPDPHNAWHQRYCTRKACQRARNRESCQKWRRKNPKHFKKDIGRSQAWRESHPHYWWYDRRKAFTVDILLPIHPAGQNTVGVRFRDLEGLTLRHVVIDTDRGWMGAWRDVGLTLQHFVAECGFRAYGWRHEREEEHVANAG